MTDLTYNTLSLRSFATSFGNLWVYSRYRLLATTTLLSLYCTDIYVRAPEIQVVRKVDGTTGERRTYR